MNRKHTDEEREQAVPYYLESGKGMLPKYHPKYQNDPLFQSTANRALVLWNFGLTYGDSINNIFAVIV